MKKLSCADLSKLKEPEKVELFTQNSVLGAIKVMGNRDSIAKIGNAVQKANEALPLAKTLELFR